MVAWKVLANNVSYNLWENEPTYCPCINSDESPNMWVQNSICRWGLIVSSWDLGTNTHTHTHTSIPGPGMKWICCSKAVSVEAKQGAVPVWGGGRQAAECVPAGDQGRSALCTTEPLAWKVNSGAQCIKYVDASGVNNADLLGGGSSHCHSTPMGRH